MQLEMVTLWGLMPFHSGKNEPTFPWSAVIKIGLTCEKDINQIWEQEKMRHKITVSHPTICYIHRSFKQINQMIKQIHIYVLDFFLNGRTFMYFFPQISYEWSSQYTQYSQLYVLYTLSPHDDGTENKIDAIIWSQIWMRNPGLAPPWLASTGCALCKSLFFRALSTPTHPQSYTCKLSTSRNSLRHCTKWDQSVEMVPKSLNF